MVSARNPTTGGPHRGKLSSCWRYQNKAVLPVASVQRMAEKLRSRRLFPCMLHSCNVTSAASDDADAARPHGVERGRDHCPIT